MRVLTLVLASLLAAATSVVIVPVSASAGAPIQHERYDFDFDFFSDEFCGDLVGPVRTAGTFSGLIQVQRKGRDKFLYYMDNFHGYHEWTNLETGKTVRLTNNGVAKDLSVTDNGDGTITIRFIDPSGSTYIGPDGKRGIINPGKATVLAVVDYAGTPDYFDDDILISEEVISDNGARNNFCEFFVAVTAA